MTISNGHAPLANGKTKGVTNGLYQEKDEGDRFGTRLVHVGSEPSEETGAVIPAISLSTTFKQSRVGVHKGYEYTRSLNPTRLAFESLIASLEGVDSGKAVDPLNDDSLPGALAFSSGSAVTAAIVQALVGNGGHLVSVGDVYGGTYRYFTKVALQTQNAEATFVDLSATTSNDPAEVERIITDRLEGAFRDNTKLVWLESPTNPTLRLVDIALVARVAHKHDIHVIVDSTFLTPYYQKALELGADIVVHSVTKYINGHSDVLSGVLATSDSALLSKLRFLQNAGGAVPSPFDAWLALRGAKTLELRMRRHGESALRVARYLDDLARGGSLVEEVIYPGLGTGYGGVQEGERIKQLSWSQLPRETREWVSEQGYSPDSEAGFPYGGMLSFRIKVPASKEAWEVSDRFLKNLRLFTLAESLGGVESLAELPSRMTHASVSEEDRRKLGIGDELIRLSVGIEDPRDLIKDLERALQKAVSDEVN